MTDPSFPLRPLRLLLLHLAFGLALPALAQTGYASREALPTAYLASYERLRLPGGEAMGLAGGTLLFQAAEDWGFGPAVYGAAGGRRGGFFVGGLQVQRMWNFEHGLTAAASLYAGGGGGAAAPVGGGLMLRPALTLFKSVGDTMNAGLSWSRVRFPSGRIDSDQIGLTLAWPGNFVHYTGGGERADPNLAPLGSGLGFERASAGLTAYRFSHGDRRRIALVEGRAEHRSDFEGLWWGLEGAAAVQGGAAGYMELLGSATLSARLLPSWQAGVRFGAGLGGGGAVPAGGGPLVKAAATTDLRPASGWSLGAELGVVRGSGSLRATYAQLRLGIDLQPAPDSPAPRGALARTEWSAAVDRYPAVLRQDGTRAALETLGLKVNRYIGDHAYWTVQAHSAYSGGAGAYSIGLLGVGLATSAQRPLRAGVEILAGAAGGGGVASAGGGRVQGLLWGGYASSSSSEWRLGIGHHSTVHRGPGGNLVELSWSRSFRLAGS